MNIDRHNYEEFFMLYADNELSAEARRDVEAFVQENPDLGEELAILNQLHLKPDAEIVFDGKESLLRTAGKETTIDATNCEEFFVLYADNELTNEAQSAVEKFVYKNPQFQADFELMQKAKMEVDTNIVFANKEKLYRHEKDEKVVPFIISIRAWKWVAAAVLILMAGLFWLNQDSGKKDNPVENIAGKTETEKKQPAVTTEQPVEEVQKEQKSLAETNSAGNNSKVLKGKTTDIVSPVQKNIAATKIDKKAQQPVAVKEIIREETASLVASGNLPIVENQPVILNEKDVASVNKNVTAVVTHKDPVIDQPIYINTDKPDREIRYADLNDEKQDDVLYVTNASVKKQNPLRGLFRKASRFVERTTNSKQGEGSGILIGNVSVALK